jgi:hypothetical protein
MATFKPAPPPDTTAPTVSMTAIDEVRIYNRALTAAQIQAEMSTPIP